MKERSVGKDRRNLVNREALARQFKQLFDCNLNLSDIAHELGLSVDIVNRMAGELGEVKKYGS